jgi:heparan-alpha-glucosaminide N-acetyltransferase
MKSATRTGDLSPALAPPPTTPAPHIRSVPAPAPATRLPAVDAFRGAVIALMVFVNYLGGMKGVPWWTQHVPSAVDGYTITDLVFPWFLFLAGVSIPLSLEKYLEAPWRALGRVLPRAGALIVLGVVFVNEHRTDAAATGMSRSLWLALVLTAAVALGRIAPAEMSRTRRRVEVGIKIAGGAALLVLMVIWRGKSHGVITPLQHQWWGILGLIGWCYLVVALAYLAARGSDRLLLGLVGLFICISIGGSLDRMGILAPLDHLFSVREICGALAAIVAAGAVGGIWLRRGAPIGRFLALGVGLWVAGWFLRPLHGYHKNDASEGWALVAAGQAMLLLALFQLAQRAPAAVRTFVLAPLALVGLNALLAYVLPDWLESVGNLLHVDLMPYHEMGGTAGLLNAAVLTIFVCVLTAIATRRRFLIRF